MKKQDVLEKIRGKIMVSCQGTNDGVNPFHTPENLLLMAQAGKGGGCVGFRANMPENVKIIKEAFPDMPMIGIWKIVFGDNEVYITPTLEAVDTLVSLKCEIVAVDATNRINAFGKYAWELIPEIKAKYPDVIVMADIATIEDADKAYEAGADIIATTLSGYTEASIHMKGITDFDLIRAIRAKYDCFIIAEGKMWTREDVKQAMECGANTVVVGTSITNPVSITERIVEYIK